MFIKSSLISNKKRARCGRRVLLTRNGVLKVGIIVEGANTSVHIVAIIQQLPNRIILNFSISTPFAKQSPPLFFL